MVTEIACIDRNYQNVLKFTVKVVNWMDKQSWIAEYGDPDKPEEWAWLQTYSAYHQAVPGQAYPPILIATTRRDDRVHPGHARKMTAKLLAMGYDQVYFYEPAAGGHGYGKDNKERAAFSALGYTFLRQKIGWS